MAAGRLSRRRAGAELEPSKPEDGCGSPLAKKGWGSPGVAAQGEMRGGSVGAGNTGSPPRRLRSDGPCHEVASCCGERDCSYGWVCPRDIGLGTRVSLPKL